MPTPNPMPFGVDAFLPQGWVADAHLTGRSPWDAELAAARRQEVMSALLCDTFLDPCRSSEPSDRALRIAPDRKTTEVDWQRLAAKRTDSVRPRPPSQS